jgi:hypothetical protein
MTPAIVKIVGEWWNYPDGVFRRVERGIYPECLVDDVPVLVMSEGAPRRPLPATTIKSALRSFRSAVGGSGIVVIARYEAGEGWLRVDNSHAKGQRETAAMAAAVTKAAWGWDQSRAHSDRGPSRFARHRRRARCNERVLPHARRRLSIAVTAIMLTQPA